MSPFKFRFWFSSIATLFLLFSVAFSQNANPFPESEIRLNGRFQTNAAQALPVSLYDLRYAVTPDSPENMARQFLRDQSKKLLGRFPDAVQELKLEAVQEMPVATTVRFQQVVKGLPVYGAELAVTLNKQHEVVFYTGTFQPVVEATDVPSSFPHIGLNVAKSYLSLKIDPDVVEERLVWYVKDGKTHLAEEVLVANASPHLAWKLVVDLATATVLFADSQTLNCRYNHPHDKLEVRNQDATMRKPLASTQALNTSRFTSFIDLPATIFDPDPLSSARVQYGANGFTDANDANSPELQAQLKSVVLKDIAFDGTNYRLKGKYVEIGDYDSPFKGLFEQSTPDFSYNRSDDTFEAVMAYYHLDKSMRYVVETLGIPVVPMQNNGLVVFDAHAEGGTDRSHFSPAMGTLYFGEGGVDDAEDADVIWHELGHGIHTWLTKGGFSNIEGLSEGISDYWAQSYSRSLNQWQPTNPEYHWMFNWDGHNVFWNGRNTTYNKKYPAELTSGQLSIETNGQIFSTTMMKIWDGLGRTNTDKMLLIGIGMLNASANQNDAANAVYQAAKLLNLPSNQVQTVYRILSETGYTLPTQALSIQFTADSRYSNADKVLTYSAKIDNDATSNRNGTVVNAPIPSGTSYIEGSATCNGTFDGTKVIFNLGTIEGGKTQTCTFKVKISPLQAQTYFFDNVENGETKWVKTHDIANFDWRVRSSYSYLSTNSWFATNVSIPSEQILTMAQATPPLSGTPQLNFWHRLESEEYDGGVVEISDDNGTTWKDAEPYFTFNGYNFTIPSNPLFGSKIAGRKAFAGSTKDAQTNNYINSVVDLSAFNGKSVLVRFRYVTDGSGSIFGWSLDNIMLANAGTITAQSCITTTEGDNKCSSTVVYVIENSTANEGNALPKTHLLTEAYPNPFNPEASFSLSVSQAQKVKIEVIDMLGRTLATLFDGYMSAQNPQAFRLDGANWQSGVYFYRAIGETFAETKKVVLMR